MKKRAAFSAIAIAAWSMIGVSLLIGFITRIVALSWYISFEPDQVSEADAYAQMWNGSWPVVGPRMTPGFYLPPLYYYLVFPFTLFGRDPWLQALPNAIFSFLSIPLLIFALYRFLTGLPTALRLFWAGAGGLWWSLMFGEIVLGTMSWNPSSIPFFALSFVMIASEQIRKPICDRIAVISWSTLGVLLALLVSLHAVTLYVMPIVFVIVSAAFIIRASLHMKAALLIAMATAIAICCLAPYWYGELHNHWQNTQMIIASLHAVTTVSLQEKFDNVWRSYKWLSGQDYFVGSNALIRESGVFFLAAVAVIGILKFRGDSVLFAGLACVWLVFLCCAANYPPGFIHYRLLIVTAPIFFAASAFAYLDYDAFRNRVLGGLLALGVLGSVLTNGSMDMKREAETFGPHRILSSSALEDAFSSIPYRARVCSARAGDRIIDEYASKRNLHFSTTCIPGSYEIVPAFIGEFFFLYRYTRADDDFFILPFEIVPGPKIPADALVVKRTEAYTVILIKKEFAPLIKSHLSSRFVPHKNAPARIGATAESATAIIARLTA